MLHWNFYSDLVVQLSTANGLTRLHSARVLLADTVCCVSVSVCHDRPMLAQYCLGGKVTWDLQ